MKQIIDQIATTSGCKVYPPEGLPQIAHNHILPEDLKEFYSICGGASLYWEGGNYGSEIVKPKDFQLANPVIVGELCEYDISSTWYILARTTGNEYLTIDLSQQRLGRCYDSYFEFHGVVGSCPIIARSFSDLLSALLSGNGDYWYWLKEGFVSLGDAYD
jgi:antitoxin YokJ